MMFRLTCLTVVCLAVAGCASISANSDYDESANFSSYRTFGWISEHPLVMTDPSASPLFEGRAMAAIAQTLQAKG